MSLTTRKNRIKRGFGGALLAATLALTFTGCSSTPEVKTPAPPTQSEQSGQSDALTQLIEEGLAQAGSDFQVEVLTKAKETGQISEADWKEANNRFKECMADLGRDVEIVYEGSRALVMEEAGTLNEDDMEGSAADRNQDTVQCQKKTNGFINEIYEYINGNSAGSSDDVQRAVLNCLIERELVPADTTYEQFVTDLEQNEGKQYSGGDNEDEITACWIENT